MIEKIVNWFLDLIQGPPPGPDERSDGDTSGQAPFVPNNPGDFMGSKHFRDSEFACKDGTPVPPEYLDNLHRLQGQLEAIRAAIGQPIRIFSGYRTPEYNRKKNGAVQSQHLTASAADIHVDGMRAPEVRKVIEQLIATGQLHDGWRKTYPNVIAANDFVHYDIRPRGGKGN